MDDPLEGLARELQQVERRLAQQTAPLRAELTALGPAGLFAVAADEQQQADDSDDAALARVHGVAARAAQTLAERLVAGTV